MAARLTAGTFLLLAVSSASLADQDFAIHMKSDDDTSATSYFSHKAVRYTSSEGDDVIVRLDLGKIINLDHEQKTYSEIMIDQWRQMTRPPADAASPQDRQQQEAMRRMGLDTGPAKLTKLGAGETIAGYATEKYLITTSSIQLEISAAPALEVPAAYYDLLSPREAAGAGPLGDMGKVFEEMKKIRGMVMKQVSTLKIMEQTTVSTTVATAVQKGPIPTSRFEVPAGYKAVPPEN
jgi:hypothetical protein